MLPIQIPPGGSHFYVKNMAYPICGWSPPGASTLLLFITLAHQPQYPITANTQMNIN